MRRKREKGEEGVIIGKKKICIEKRQFYWIDKIKDGRDGNGRKRSGEGGRETEVEKVRGNRGRSNRKGKRREGKGKEEKKRVRER